MNPVSGLGSEKSGMEDEKQSKIAFFSKFLFKKNHKAEFFLQINLTQL